MEKEVLVYSVTPSTEVATGDNTYNVFFGDYVNATPEIISTLQLQVGQPLPKKVGVFWLILNIKSDEVPYRIGSRWRLTVENDGRLTLVEMKK